MARIPQRLDPVEDRVRDFLLGGQRYMVLAARLDDHDLVLSALAADLRARAVGEEDRVGALALNLLPGPRQAFPSLRREPDDRLTFAPASAERGEDVLGLLQVELETTASLAVDLLSGGLLRAEVRRRRGHHQHV